MGEFRETEYGKAPIDWRVLKIGDVTRKLTDGAHQSPKPQVRGKYMCSVKDMTYDKFDFSGCKLISDEDYEKLINQGCQPEKGDILISKDGANCLDLIFVFRQREDLVLLSSIAIARLLPEYIPEYVRYFLLSPGCQYIMRNNYVSGSAIPRVVLKDFKQVPILVPPLPEQKAIASVLSSLDDKIDLLHRQNKTLESMAETLFRQWFVEEARDDWDWVELGQFIEVMRGLSYKGSGLADINSGIPMHNLNSVHEGGGYKFEGIKYYSGDYRERHLVQPGDIIITNTEQGHDFLLIGYPAIVPSYFGNLGIFSQHIYKIGIKNDNITTPFLFYLLMSYDVREQIVGSTNGSTVNMLPKNGIEWAKFKMPPEIKINEFTAIVEPMMIKKEKNYYQVRTLEKLRDTLLPKLMSGEVRVEYEH